MNVKLPLKDQLTLIVAVAGIGFGLIQYRSTSHGEFLKPIRETQLRLYEEASSAAATLATAPKESAEWKKADADFLRLFYGPMAIVENYQEKVKSENDREVTVELAMIAFKACLDDSNCNGSDMMPNLSLALAHTCRISLGQSWGFTDAQLQGKYQEIIKTYSGLYQNPNKPK